MKRLVPGLRGRLAAIAAALCAAIVVPGERRPDARPGRRRRAGNARALGAALVADHPRQHRALVWSARRSRLQHAARAGARPRRRVLHEQPRAARRGSRAPAGVVRSARDACSPRRRRTGIRVHAWVNVNLVSSAVDLPASPDHLVYRHPEWLMVPREIAQEVARLDPGNPGYVGKIARWTRGADRDASKGSTRRRSSPTPPPTPSASSPTSRAATTSTASISTTRAIPNQQFDYSRFAIAEFRADIRPRLSAERAPRARRGRSDRSLRVSRSLPGRVEGVPPRAADGARRAHPRRRCAPRGPTRSLTVGGDARSAGRLRRAAAGLARLARQRTGRRRRADGLHAGAGALRRADRRRPRHRRRPRAIWAGIGAYRLTPGADDREHPGRAPARRRRLRPLLLRQPDGPEAARARLPRDGQPRGVPQRRDARLQIPDSRAKATRTRSRPVDLRPKSQSDLLIDRVDASTRDRARVPRRRRSKSAAATASSGARAFGTLTYAPTRQPRRDDTIFDLASLTKVIATATAGDARGRRRDARRSTTAWPIACRRGAAPIARRSRSRDLLEHASGLTAYLRSSAITTGAPSSSARSARCRSSTRRARSRSTAIWGSCCWLHPRGRRTSRWTLRGRRSRRRRMAVRLRRSRSAASTRRGRWRERTRADGARSLARTAAAGRSARREHAGRSAAPPATRDCSAPPRRRRVRARDARRLLGGTVDARDGRATLARFVAASRPCPAARARSAGTRCCRPRRAARGCRRARSATPASPARRCGSIPSRISTSCC